MRIIAVDYGDARTGLAVCDSSETIATPAAPVNEKNFLVCAEKVAQAAKENRAELIVVGLPLNMNGTEGERALKCREFAAKVEEISGIKTDLWDERGTTKTAIYFMNETDTRGKKRKAQLDSASAAIILQNYIDMRKNRGIS